MTESKKEKALEEFMEMPGFGIKSAQQLWEIGIRSIADLKNKDPEIMYLGLMESRGVHVDRCVLYDFREAVYYASHENHDSELLK